MKKPALLFILCGLSCFINAQTTAEWAQQKKTQIRYLLQQIAANKVYTGYIEKGYSIARNGLNTIQRIQQGDFALQQDFIHSLRRVNPAIGNSAKVTAIVAIQLGIIKHAKTTIKHLTESGEFTASELSYCKAVFDNLLEDCLKSIDELYLVLAAGELEMKDAERIQRIDNLYVNMQDKYSFCQSFSRDCSVLAIQRTGERMDIETSKKLNGLK
ncbi:hypothetical protein [Terrimonas alba]|uniref:hypothetical protein n=1 Tax=Terrimonas alba TaxID=3349636 RepID=UPI0035F297E0